MTEPAASPADPPAPWLLLQLVDSAFPSGGFTHSAGLEAAVHLRGVPDLEAFVVEVLLLSARTTLPFVRAACERTSDLASLDGFFDATCTSHVANRASRTQGRALAAAACRIFETPRMQELGTHARRGPAHHAPMFGATMGALGVTPRDAQIAWLHAVLRGVLSAAVRLGVVGPLEAQQIQASRAKQLDALLASCMHLEVDAVAQTSPLLELFGTLHDRLDGHLFQS